MRRLQLMLFLLTVFGVAVIDAKDEQHFIDVRELVKDTLDAIKDVPTMMEKNKMNETSVTTATSKPAPATGEAASDVYKSLLKLPADIMSRLALDAGYVYAPAVTPTAAGGVKNTDQSIMKAKNRDDEKAIDKDASYSFKTLEDVQAEERRRLAEQPTMSQRKAPSLEDNDDVFSISKLISATGNAIREAQAQQATIPPLIPLPPSPLAIPGVALNTLPAQQSEVVYRPVVRDGKTVYEQLVLLKSADGTTKIISQSIFNQLPVVSDVSASKKTDIKQVKTDEFAAPTFPPMINVFTEPTSTQPSVPSTTSASAPVKRINKKRRKTLPHRKVEYMMEKKKKMNPTMHSRQFGAKTLQMSDPIQIQAHEDVAVNEEIVAQPNILEKEGKMRVRTIKRRHFQPILMGLKQNLDENEKKSEQKLEEPLKKKKKLNLKSLKKSKKTMIRTIPDLYDVQYKKTQVAPSVSKPSEQFANEFADIDETQDAIIASANNHRQVEQQQDDPVESTSSKTQRQSSSKLDLMTQKQIEDLLDAEIHKRVVKRIQSAKTKSAEILDDDQEVILTTTRAAPTHRLKKPKRSKKTLISRNQCANLRSFARQFLFDSVEDFAREHCYFIENYYPHLKCSKVSNYVEKCQKYFDED